MSRVFRAIEPRLTRRVAIKILNAKDNRVQAEVEHFLEEAKIVSRLTHPGIIPIYDCGIRDGEAFMVMRFMENGSLDQHRKDGTLPPREVLLEQLATVTEGLAYAGEHGVTHHDVKPGNILLTKEGEAKLGDFDLADTEEFQPVRGNFASPAYVSPERLYFGAEDSRGDIFSLGATIYELLTGVAPFGSAGEPEELLARRNRKAYRRLTEYGCSKEFSDLIDRMLSYSPEERPKYQEIIPMLRAEAEKFRNRSGRP